MKLSVKREYSSNNLVEDKVAIKTEFSKLFFKKNGKFYSSLIPQF
jgi:hypothetical protein